MNGTNTESKWANAIRRCRGGWTNKEAGVLAVGGPHRLPYSSCVDVNVIDKHVHLDAGSPDVAVQLLTERRHHTVTESVRERWNRTNHYMHIRSLHVYSSCSGMQWRRNEFESGGTGPARNFCRTPPLFGSKSIISRFCERFRDGQYTLVSFVFAVLITMPRVPSHL